MSLQFRLLGCRCPIWFIHETRHLLSRAASLYVVHVHCQKDLSSPACGEELRCVAASFQCSVDQLLWLSLTFSVLHFPRTKWRRTHSSQDNGSSEQKTKRSVHVQISHTIQLKGEDRTTSMHPRSQWLKTLGLTPAKKLPCTFSPQCPRPYHDLGTVTLADSHEARTQRSKNRRTSAPPVQPVMLHKQP